MAVVLRLGWVLAAAPWAPAALGKDAGGAKPPQLAARAKAHQGPGVRVLFDQAQQLFDAGKYNEALSAYRSLLHRFPGHTPSQVQLAKTLYRLERIKEAQQVFAKLNLKEQDLDAETSYEYGWSFYTIKAWEPALAGFQRVPAGHSLYDLANYYGAVCAIKLKKLELAEDMLDKAVVLPDKLAKSRSLYIKHVQALRLMHERAGLAQERVQEKEIIVNAAAPDRTKFKKEAPTLIVAEGPPRHVGFKSVQKSAAVLRFEIAHQNITANGVAQPSFDSSTPSFTFTNGYLQQLGLAAGKDYQGSMRQAAFGLQLALGAENRSTHGGEQLLLSDETYQSLTRQFNYDLAPTPAKSGQGTADLWLEVPLPASLWASVGAEYSLTYYDFSRGQRIGYRRAYADLRGKYAGGNAGVVGGYSEILGVDGQTIVQISTAQVGGEVEIMPKLVLAATGTYDSYNYLARGLNLDGPDSVTTAEASLQQRLPLGIKIRLAAAYQLEPNYIFRHVPSFPALSADGQAFTGKGSLEIAPIPLVSAGLSEVLTTTTWREKNLDAKDSFDNAVPTFVEYFTAWVAVNLAF